MSTTLQLESAADLNDVAVVLRGNFNTQGIVRERGEVLTTTGWRNAQALINTRYLGAAPYDLLETKTECECGRMWIDQAHALAHQCPARKKTRKVA